VGRHAVMALAVVAVLATTGCAAVKPWEREILARGDMAWDPDPHQAAIRNHVYFSKEATLTGGGSGGGGCGCN
jgi:hypothetical protein